MHRLSDITTGDTQLRVLNARIQFSLGQAKACRWLWICSVALGGVRVD